MSHLKDKVVSIGYAEAWKERAEKAEARVSELEAAMQRIVTALSRPHDTYPYMLGVDTIAAGLRLNLTELRALLWGTASAIVGVDMGIEQDQTACATVRNGKTESIERSSDTSGTEGDVR